MPPLMNTLQPNLALCPSIYMATFAFLGDSKWKIFHVVVVLSFSVAASASGRSIATVAVNSAFVRV